MSKNMYVVTPRCAAAAAAAVVSAVVLRRPSKECANPYSMIHRRLPTADIEVAPHYHHFSSTARIGILQFYTHLDTRCIYKWYIRTEIYVVRWYHTTYSV